jgi:hypothetical protein
VGDIGLSVIEDTVKETQFIGGNESESDAPSRLISRFGLQRRANTKHFIDLSSSRAVHKCSKATSQINPTLTSE